MKLTKKDYGNILKHYKKKVPKTRKKRKETVEKILSAKMCKCIKAVQKTSKLEEPGAIAICNKSIFRNRNLKFNRISCKKGYKFIKGKKTQKKLVKTGTLKMKAKKLKK